MRIGDVVRLVWEDSGLHCHNMSLEEALAEELQEVTVYGKIVSVDERKVVIEQEAGRGDVGTYGVIARSCVKEVTVLNERSTPTAVLPLGSVSGWADESSAPQDTQELAVSRPCGHCRHCRLGWEEICSG